MRDRWTGDRKPGGMLDLPSQVRYREATKMKPLAVPERGLGGALIRRKWVSECEFCHEVQSGVRQRIPGDRNAASVCDTCHEEWLDGATLEEAMDREQRSEWADAVHGCHIEFIGGKWSLV